MVDRLPMFTLPVLMIIVIGTGCSMVPKADSTDTAQSSEMPPNQPMILVELQSKDKTSDTVRIPLANAPTLQAAVNQSKADSRFGRFHIAISRLPQYPGAQPEKLISKYDHTSNSIPFEYDYQLRPGDRVVIVQDTRNSLDDMFGKIVGPLRRAAGGESTDKSPF